MTVSLSGQEVAKEITKHLPDAVSEANDQVILVKSESLFEVAKYLKNSPGLDFDYLNGITAVDYYDYFELIYQLTSLKHNHSLVLKTRCYGRNNPTLPSIVRLWRGAGFQERAIYDLMGIRLDGQPNSQHLIPWEGL